MFKVIWYTPTNIKRERVFATQRQAESFAWKVHGTVEEVK